MTTQFLARRKQLEKSLKKLSPLSLLREVVAASRNIGNVCVGTVMHSFLILNCVVKMTGF
jgi:hypothetical protein